MYSIISSGNVSVINKKDKNNFIIIQSIGIGTVTVFTSDVPSSRTEIGILKLNVVKGQFCVKGNKLHTYIRSKYF